jgi:hypothetical protein
MYMVFVQILKYQQVSPSQHSNPTTDRHEYAPGKKKLDTMTTLRVPDQCIDVTLDVSIITIETPTVLWHQTPVGTEELSLLV